MESKKANWMVGIVLVLTLLMWAGLVMDMFSGFSAIRESGSVLGVVGTLLLMGTLYMMAEGVGSSMSSIDKVAHPLWRRALNLLGLLISIGVLVVFIYYALNYFKI